MKKSFSRLVALIAVFVLFAAALPALSLADSTSSGVVTYTSDATGLLQLYAAPSVTSQQLGRYYNGTSAQVLYTTSTGWSQVMIGTQYGYVKTANLLDASAGDIIDACPRYVSTADSWQLWQSPSYTASYEVLGSGVEIRLLGLLNGWWHVEVSSQTSDSFNHTVTGYVPASSSQFQLVSGSYTAGYATAVVKNPNSGDRLNLREEPTSKSKSLGKYYNGTVVAILDKSNDWYMVQIGNTTGWMSGAYLDVSPNQHTVKDVRPSLTVLGNNTELFYDSSETSTIVTAFAAGTKLTVLGVCSTWYHVEYNGEYGYVRISDMSAGDTVLLGSGSTTIVRPAWQSKNAGDIATAPWPLSHDHNNDGVLDYTVAFINNPNPNNRLNLREEPSTGSDSLGRYYNGVQAQVLEQRSDGWVRVSINGVGGWMDSSFTTLSTNPADAPASQMPVLYIRNPNPSARLNLRQGKSTSTTSLGIYPNGTQVIVLGYDTTWAHVYVDGKTGYMLAHYLQEK